MLMQKGHKVELEERIDVLLSGQREVLELLASGEPRDKVLEKLVKSIELQTNGMRCSIVLLDDEGKHIKSCVAPSLPEFYNTALIGFAIGPKAGSCGTAAYRRQPVIVTDIFSDPLWSDYIDLARLSKLRACWSYPIILRDGHVLGTFAMYYHEVRTPTEIEVKLIEEASKIGAAILQQIQMKETFENFISLLNKSKMAFAQSEEKFRKLHENAPEAFVVVNGENFIEAINKRAEVLFGYTSSELMGKPIEILIPERFHASHRSHHSKYAQCPRMRPMGENRDIFGRKKDGSEFAADIMLSPVQVEKQVLVMASIKDTTQQKRAEQSQAVVLSHERLAREIAEKSVQLRDDFLSVAAHELKTPLTAFKMQIEFLKKLLSEESCSNLPKIETILNAIETSKDQLEQFLRLLDDLLNAQHISSGKLFIERENVDLSFIIRNVIESYQEIIRKDGCSIKLATDSSINGFWDSARVRQVVSNLVSNAIKYGAGAPIEVETSRVGSSARIMVRDHGIGIAKEEQGKLFRRFERVTSAKGIQGFGLGLYITKQIVEAHGGKIWVESEPSKGSTFYVELPLEK